MIRPPPPQETSGILFDGESHAAISISSPRERYRIYGLLACLFFAAGWLTVSFKKDWSLIVSDGAGYYAYLPSVILDHDLDMANQFARPKRVNEGQSPLHESAPSPVTNKYPIGFALTLLPAFLLSEGVTLIQSSLLEGRYRPSDGYSFTHQCLAFMQILLLIVLTMIMADHILGERFAVPAPQSLFSILLIWTGTPALYYSFREPFMVHMVSGFWVTAVAYFCHRLHLPRTPPHPLDFEKIAVLPSLSMALVARPTNVVVIVFILALFLSRFLDGRLQPWTRKDWSLLACGGFIASLPIFLQTFAWQQMFGHWIYYSYGEEGFQWLTPALWQTLFSFRHGLFTWTPLLLFSFLGIALALKEKRDPWLWASLAAFLLLWYCNSSWRHWWFGDAFGGRAFMEMSNVYAVGLGLFLKNLEARPASLQYLAKLILAFCVAGNLALMLLYILHIIPRS